MTSLEGLLHDNMTIAAGGFGRCGIPGNLIAAFRDSGVKGLTIAVCRPPVGVHLAAPRPARVSFQFSNPRPADS